MEQLNKQNESEQIKNIFEDAMCEMLNRLIALGYKEDKIHINIKIESEEYGLSQEQTTQI